MTPSDSHHRPARKRFGQNFLIQPHAIEQIVDAVKVRTRRSSDRDRARTRCPDLSATREVRLLAIVELDRDLVADWSARELAALEILPADVRQIDWAQLAADKQTANLTVVSNLPFNVSKPVALALARASNMLLTLC